MLNRNLETLVKEYLDFCSEQKRLSLETVRGYQIDLKQFVKAAPNGKDPFSKEFLNGYCRILNSKYKSRTAKRKLASIRAFSHWLEFEEYLPADPFRRVNTKTARIIQIPRYLTLIEMQGMLETAYHKRETASAKTPAYYARVRDVAILELLFGTGLRVSELCALRKEDIQLEPAAVRVTGKGNKERIIPIENEEIIAAIQTQENVHNRYFHESKTLFQNQLGGPLSQQSVRNMVAKCAKEAGISGRVTPHILRHTFATLMLEQGVDIRYIQNLLGHSSIKTTEIYTSVAVPKERQIVAAQHPRNLFSIKNTG